MEDLTYGRGLTYTVLTHVQALICTCEPKDVQIHV